MSVSIGVIAAVAMHLTIGNATEREMQPYVWEQAGLCKVEAESTAETCNWVDGSRECRAAQVHNLPCPVNHEADLRNEDDAWLWIIPRDEQTFQELTEPRWVLDPISGRMKLQL
jgi:hypothetical protein